MSARVYSRDDFKRALPIVAACVLATVGCSKPRVSDPTVAKPIVTAAAATLGDAAPLAVPTVAASVFGPWNNIDALPPGATARLGSRWWTSSDRRFAVTPDGQVTAYYDQIGLIQYRDDGWMRRININCQRPTLWSSGMQILAACENKLFVTIEGDQLTSRPYDCDDGHYPQLSADRAMLLCTGENNVELTSGWTYAINVEGYFARVSNSGIAVVAESRPRMDSALVAIKDGKLLWRHDAVTFPAAIDEKHQEVVSYRASNYSGGGRFYILDLLTGQLKRTVGPIAKDLEGDILMHPDGVSWIVTLKDWDSTLGLQANFVARIDSKTGALVEQWHHGEYKAISSDGEWGLFSQRGRFTRLNLADKSAPIASASSDLEPYAMVSSHNGTALAVVSQPATFSGPYRLQTFDIKTSQSTGSATLATDVDSVIFSPDASSLAVLEPRVGLSILDSTTLTVRCRVTQSALRTSVSAGEVAFLPLRAALYWRGATLALVERGDEVDGNDGSVTILNDHCKLIRQHRKKNMLAFYVNDDATALTVRWQSRIARDDNLAAQTFSDITWPTGKISPARRQIVRGWLGNHWLPAEQELIVDQDLQSADGQTRLANVRNNSGYQLRCFDESGKTLSAVTAPPEASGVMAIAGNGAWFAVGDGTSVLIYPCRK